MTCSGHRNWHTPEFQPGEIVARAVDGSVFSMGSACITVALGALRLVLLTHWLLPEDVGVAVQALVLIGIAVQLQSLGLNEAVIHRPVTDDGVLGTYVTLQLGLRVGMLAALAVATPLVVRFYAPMPGLAGVLVAFILVEMVVGVNAVLVTLLRRRLAFRPLAVTDVSCSVVMTAVAPTLAWLGFGVWSLVAEQASAAVTRLLVLGGVFRVRIPRPAWDRRALEFLLRYGRSVWASTNLDSLLVRFDDLWIGRVLGHASLGVYARAYEFARFPRRVIANPITAVFLPTFARLQHDRLRLSRAFFRVTAVMVRAGFLFSLVFVLVARELVELVGAQWLEMVPVLQLLAVYALLDPLSQSSANLLLATGHPELVTRARAIQTALFLPAVVAATALAGIVGVAVVADLTMMLGTLLLFARCRSVVDYSPRAMWLWPSVAVCAAVGVAVALFPVWGHLPPWIRLLEKAAVACLVYGGVLWLAERETLRMGAQLILELLKRSRVHRLGMDGERKGSQLDREGGDD